MTNATITTPASDLDDAPLRSQAVGVAGTRPTTPAGVLAERAPDDELVRRAQAGELAAFESLVTRHERRLYTLARRITRHEHDAQDVTQQAFLSALEHLAGFRGQAGFSTWLLRIGTHAALKVLRKRQGLPTVALGDNTEPPAGRETGSHPADLADWRESPGHLADKHETRRLVEAALNRLDEKHRLVFVLRDMEGMSVRETAVSLGLSEANVKVRLLRARLQLRDHLRPFFGVPACVGRRLAVRPPAGCKASPQPRS
ncbi:MAG: sigma-70 family RNA polymerase sigma factor [Opitutaceae bacterium]|nr:sigma-70 family RNA polymerase sigma factor [Opitutaceae bacterium]